MYLTREEEKALSGERGEALATAYRILLAVGKLTKATRLVSVVSAHVSGVSHLTIGDYGAEFLERFSAAAKVVVPTTVNPCGMDLKKWRELGVNEEFARKQLGIVESYRRMGVRDSYTCIPYAAFPTPPVGSHVSWAESSAAIYGNSMLGLRTNRESALSALASAVTGKTPYSDLHLDENRRAAVRVRVKTRRRLQGSLDFGLLGYFAGRLTDRPIGFDGVASLTPGEAKALAAAIGTSGGSGMFVLGGSIGSVETVDFTEHEWSLTRDELSDGEVAEAIVLGCPQVLREEMAELAGLVQGRRFRRRCLLFCPRPVYEQARRQGFTRVIEEAGGEFVCDACADFTPIVGGLGVKSVVTDACKGAHYMKRVHGVKTVLADLKSLVRAYTA